MKSVVIIPARMGSSRFPGKPMAKICGIPMIGHVWFRCKMSTQISGVYVATCDQEIYDYVKSIGGSVIMTSDKHERASDRCAEALASIEKEIGRVDVVVMVQGDEPLTWPNMIDASIAPFVKFDDVNVVNLLGRIKSEEEFRNPNCIKVATDFKGDAIYFSRSPIPYLKNWDPSSVANKQVCVIPFRREYLLKFSELPPVKTEVAESIDMLRFIENGIKVRMVPTDFEIQSVDTPQDLLTAESMMKSDALFAKYANHDRKS